MSITDAAVEAELRGRLDQLWGWAKAGKQTDPHDPSVEYYLMDTENVAKFTDHVLDLLEALKPVVVDRAAIERVLRERMLNSNFTVVTHEPLRTQVVDQWVQVFADAVAALYPKATEGKS